MFGGGVIFQGVLLAPGSHAYKLFHDKKWEELRAHMKALEEMKRKLEGRTNA